MLLLYLFIALLSLVGAKLRKKGEVLDPLSRDQSTMIKGMFVLLVFASHISQYLGAFLDSSVGNMAFLSRTYVLVRDKLGQFIVVPFLFYSGYGIRIQAERTENAYFQSFPRKRILRVYSHALLILAVFLLVQLALGTSYSARQIGLSAVFWESLGNSNWYVFAVILLYCITYLCFRLLRKPWYAALACWLLTLAYCVWISRYKEAWWFDSVLAYCYGLSYPALRRSGLFKRISRSLPARLGCLAAALIVYQYLRAPANAGAFVSGLFSNLRYIAAMQALLLILRQLQIGNRVLNWLGKHSFEVYMLQRIPMLVLSHFKLQAFSVPVFIASCALATVLLSALCAAGFSRFDRNCLRIKQAK